MASDPSTEYKSGPPMGQWIVPMTDKSKTLKKKKQQ